MYAIRSYYVDLEATELLEAALGAYEGALLLVSHDRFFLGRTVAKRWRFVPKGREVLIVEERAESIMGTEEDKGV